MAGSAPGIFESLKDSGLPNLIGGALGETKDVLASLLGENAQAPVASHQSVLQGMNTQSGGMPGLLDTLAGNAGKDAALGESGKADTAQALLERLFHANAANPRNHAASAAAGMGNYMKAPALPDAASSIAQLMSMNAAPVQQQGKERLANPMQNVYMNSLLGG